MSTAAERATWKALAEGATPGEWDAVPGAFGDPSGGPDHMRVVLKPHRNASDAIARLEYDRQCGDDAAFIAAARTAVPALLTDVERLERELFVCGVARDLAEQELRALEAENRRLREADL